jgi:Holliday junction DNA helicase RuvA
MIEYIKGELTELTPALATVEAAGVGYALNISLNTYSACQKYLSKAGEAAKTPVKLYVYEAIREDAYVLYGFYNKKERRRKGLRFLRMCDFQKKRRPEGSGSIKYRERHRP